MIDCEEVRLNPVAAVDALIVQITESLEFDGHYEFKLSPIERVLIARMRTVKNLVPTILIRRIKNLLKGGKTK